MVLGVNMLVSRSFGTFIGLVFLVMRLKSSVLGVKMLVYG